MMTQTLSSAPRMLLTRLLKKLRGDSGPAGTEKDLLEDGLVEREEGFRDMNDVREPVLDPGC